MVTVDELVESENKVTKLEEQNKRYEEALEFYADENTHKFRNATDDDAMYDPFTLIEIDNGKEARKALENK